MLEQPNSVDRAATAMEEVDPTTGLSPTLLADSQNFLDPGVERRNSAEDLSKTSAVPTGPSRTSPTTEQTVNSASGAVPIVLSPEEHQDHHHSSGTQQQTKRTLSSSISVSTNEAQEREADEGLKITSAPEPILPKSSPSLQEVRKDDVPPAQVNKTQYVDPDDYEKRFPEDEMGEETGPNARVWRTYLVESKAFDDNMIEEARDGLDALLVFAGLFSGVVTSFVVQTSQSLQQASTDVSASLLFELIAVQRAAANGTPVSSVPPSPLTPNSNFGPKTLDVWVNSLWFVSLVLNLVVALGAVLVKQWLHRYVARRSGTPKEQSHMRQYRFDGFEQWQVLAITGWLPVIMHFSLAIFSVGLVLFLNPLQAALSWTLAALAGLVYILYITTNLLPLFCPHCPYQTPLSDFLCSSLQPLIQKFRDIKLDVHMDDMVSVAALQWLFRTCSNPSTCKITQQAIGGLPGTVMDKIPSSLHDELCHDILRVLRLSCTQDHRYEHQYYIPLGMERVAERLLRSYTLLFHPAKASFGIASSRMPRFSFPAESNDLRYMLTSLAFEDKNPCLVWDPECLQAILSHNDVPHQASIWMTIVKNSMRIRVFSNFAMEPDLVKQLLPIIIWNTSIDQSPDACTSTPTASGRYTMAEAINQFMRNAFCTHLATSHLVDVDPLLHQLHRILEVTPASRALMVTMSIALQQISTNNKQNAHWENIVHILSLFLESCKADEFEMGTDSAVLASFFQYFVERLIEETDICQSNPQGSKAVLHHRQLVIDVYLKTRSKFHLPSLSESHLHSFLHRSKQLLPFYRPSQHINAPIREFPHSEFTSLRRAIEGSLCDIPKSTTIDPNVAYPPILQAISIALQADCAAAYELVAQYDCLDLLHKYKSAKHNPSSYCSRCPRAHLSQQFITGLINGVVKGTAKTSCIVYLTANLHRFTILWIAEEACDCLRKQRRLGSVEFPAKELAGLLSHENLQDLQPWLSKVLTWPRYGWRADTSSRLELGDESMQEFWETAFWGIELFDVFRTMEAVIEALDRNQNTTEPKPVSAPADTNAMPSSHPDANEGKVSRFIRNISRRRERVQDVSVESKV